MKRADALPRHALVARGPVSRAFLERGIDDYRAAAAFVHALPYGRNRDRADPSLVLEENRGTCSTKHALLAVLAREQSLPIELVVGIYDMNESNTPGVGSVLEAAGLASLPEAHCYLRFAGERVDVTRDGVEAESELATFHREWTIEPSQIGDHKLQLHREQLAEWIAADAERAQRCGGLEGVWSIRERCIAALAESD